MAIRNFGLKEAKRASEFAKTDEQRRTVLAVTRMFNIPIVIKQQAVKVVSRMELAFKKKHVKIRKLDIKSKAIEGAARTDILKKVEALEVRKDWDI